MKKLWLFRDQNIYLQCATFRTLWIFKGPIQLNPQKHRDVDNMGTKVLPCSLQSEQHWKSCTSSWLFQMRSYLHNIILFQIRRTARRQQEEQLNEIIYSDKQCVKTWLSELQVSLNTVFIKTYMRPNAGRNPNTFTL